VASFRNETVVGIIVFCSLVVLVLGLMWLEDQHFRGRGYILEANFDDVSGLNQGDPVTVAGLPIGRVHDMQLDEAGVVTSLLIESEHEIPKGSMAILKSQGVMGEKYVDVVLGEGSGNLQAGDIIPGLYQVDLNQVFTQMGSVGQNLEAVLSQARTLLDDSTEYGIRGSMTSVGAAAAQLKNLIDRNAERLDETIANLHDVSSALAGISPGDEPQELIPNLETASQDLAATAARLKKFSASLDSLLLPTMRGESTLGKLLSDEALYRDCQTLVGHLDSLVQDVRENPGRYFKVEIF